MSLNRRQILKILMIAFLFAGTAMLIPLLFALNIEDHRCAAAFGVLVPILFAAGLGCGYAHRKAPTRKKHIKPKDAYLSIALGWLLVLFVCSLPYALSRHGYTLMDGWFESAAAWTTTGATVLDLRSLPRTLLLWKAMNSWFGGMVLTTLTLTLFPRLGIAEQQITDNDFTGTTTGKLSPKLSSTLKISFALYGVLTLISLFLLLPSGMRPFYAVLNAMTCVSTAGLIDITGTSGAFLITPYIKFVLAVVALLSSVNFLTYYYTYRRKFRLAREYYEVRFYFRILLAASLSMTLVLYVTGTYRTLPQAFGNALVQTLSFSSTSGFVMGGISHWPVFCEVVLLVCALIGGCSFSTASGMKVSRAMVFLKLMTRGVDKRIHPHSTRAVNINGKAVPAKRASSITVFIMLYILVFILGCILMGIENQDMETTFTCVIASLTNTGTGFGKMASANYSIFSGFGRFISTLIMMTGRLEIYPMLLLLSKTFWASDHARLA